MAEPELKETKTMKKIISLSIEEELLKRIDNTRGQIPRSRLIELIIMNWYVNEYDETILIRR